MVKRIALKISGENTVLKKIIDKQSVEEAKETKKIRSSLYASDYGQCQRKTWFQFFPEEFPPDEDFSPRTYRIFANGNDVHVRLSRYLNRETELEFVEEVNVPRDDLDVHGRCDGICKIDNRATVTEFKSINAKEVYEPKKEHLGQLTWYLHMFMKLRREVKEDFGLQEDDVVFPDDIEGEESLSGRTLDDLNQVEKWLLFSHQRPIGEVIYEAKGTQELFHFRVEYDESKAAEVRQWFEQVANYVKSKEIPPARYKQNQFPCSWGYGPSQGKCSYYDRCWGSNGLNVPQKELINIGEKNSQD